MNFPALFTFEFCSELCLWFTKTKGRSLLCDSAACYCISKSLHKPSIPPSFVFQFSHAFLESLETNPWCVFTLPCLYYPGLSFWHVFSPYVASKLLVILQSPERQKLSQSTRTKLIAPTLWFSSTLKTMTGAQWLIIQTELFAPRALLRIQSQLEGNSLVGNLVNCWPA